jgi:O-antigen/teichoic acid export membrane protein
MSNRKKILSGVIVDYAGSTIAVIIGFIVIPYYFDYITKIEFGVWLVVSGVVALFSMADLGTDQYLTTVTSNNDKFYGDVYADYISSILFIKIIVAIVITSIAVITYLFLTSIVDIDIAYQEAAKFTFILSSSMLVLGLFFSTISTILYARHHYSLINSFVSVFSVTTSLGTVFLLSLGFGVASFPLALLSSASVQYSILFIYLLKKYPNIKLKIRGFRFIDKKEIIGYTTSFQVLKWVHTLRVQYITIAINNLIGPVYLTQYNLTNKLPQMIPQYAVKIIHPFFPTVSDLFHKKDFNGVTRVLIKITKILSRVAILSGLLVFMMNESFITLWVGSNMFAGSWVVLWMVVYMIGHIALGFFGIIIFSSKKFEKWIQWSIIEIISAVLLSYVLNIWFSFSGIVAGIVLASLPNQYYLFHIVLKQLAIKKSDFIKNIITYALVPNILPAVLIAFFYLNYNINNWFEFVVVGLLAVISSLLSWEAIQYYLKRSRI